MSSVRAFGPTVDVSVLRWPAEATARTLLAQAGRARVLVVAPDSAAPTPIDDLEDWLRDPVDPVELVARSDALRRRVAQAAVPYLDDDGLLHVGCRWVSISDTQLPMIRLLLERFGHLVRTEELVEAYTAAGGTDNPSSIRTAIVRVRSRLASVGLTLHAARQRGVVLAAASEGDE